MSQQIPTGLVIRPYALGDEAGVKTLWQQVLNYPTAWNDSDQLIQRKLRQRDGLFLVAELNGQLVGTVLAGYDGVRGWIYRLGVLPDHQGQGIGRELLACAEQKLQARGCPKVNLQTTQSNAGVVPFYEGAGYRVEERVSMGKPLLGEVARSVPEPVPTLRISEELTLSQMTWDDKPALVKYLNQTEEISRRTATIPWPYTDADADEWLNTVTQDRLTCDQRRIWAIRESGGELIGGCGFHAMIPGHKAEIGYWLALPFWGRGWMTQIIGPLTEFGFREYDLRRIYARIYAFNPASARVLEKCGYQCEGRLRGDVCKNGEIFDDLMYARLRDD